jgi:putative spermidine/putrescine transport system permease protein
MTGEGGDSRERSGDVGSTGSGGARTDGGERARTGFAPSARLGEPLVKGLLVVVLAFFTVPIVLTIVTSLATSAEGVLPSGLATFENWRQVLGFGDFGVRRDVRADLVFSMGLATGGMAINLLVGVPIAYALTRYEFPGRRALNVFAILPLVPGVILGIAFLRAYPQNASSWFGLVTGYALLKSPFMVLTVQSSFQSMDLERLEESARSLGASWPRTFLTVIVPNAKNGIIAGCIITWTLAAAEFNFTYMVHGRGPRPFSLFLFENISNSPVTQSAAAISIYFLVVVGAILVLQLLGNRGFTTTRE